MALTGAYAPPGVYTQTNFDTPVTGVVEFTKIPILIGTGQEQLTQESLEIPRGSSSSVDQRVPLEDQTGRAILSEDPNTGALTLGDFDGVSRRFQVLNFPITNGQGNGAPTTDLSAVLVFINGQPDVVLGLDGVNGVVEISTAPQPGDEVRCTYFFNRTDTLTTDNLSSQVDPLPARIEGSNPEDYVVITGQNDELVLSLDGGAPQTFIIPSGTWSAQQLAALFQTGFTGLTASAFTDNLGQRRIRLQSEIEILVGGGTANTLVGLTSGESSGRNRTFYTFNGPIVDGSNGGITTTDPADVTVRVNGAQVIPSAVDGQTRAVTLPFAPARGSVVEVTYWFNTWQDTFDYLGHIGVTNIDRVGVTPDRSDFIEEADWVLKNDRIVWGSAALTTSGTHTAGATLFNDTQISTTLVDNRAFLEECTPVTDTSVVPASTSTREWQLPFVPTTGNGRNTPLGVDLFNQVSNGRTDLPTNRPDLVVAYWGFDVQDALDRGPVQVLRVESTTSTITLDESVDVGAKVYATFYYNTLVDEEYTLESLVAGPSGSGSYRVTDDNGGVKYAASLDSKGAALATVTLQFPSGSELTPDARLESPIDARAFTGPVEEVVTVKFVSRDETPAKYTFPGMAPYYTVFREGTVGPGPYYPGPYSAALSGSSHRFRATVDNVAAMTGLTSGFSIHDPTGTGSGFTASLLGDEVQYDAASGGTTFAINSGNNELSLMLDGEPVFITAASNPTATLDDFVSAINTAVDAINPVYRAAAAFSAYEVVAGQYDQLVFHYTGDVSTLSGDLTATLAPGTYGTPAALATALQAAIDAEITALVGLSPAFAGLQVSVTSDASGRLFFELTRATGDAAGYLEFISNASPERDFAIIAAIDTDTATAGAQTKLLSAPIAKRYSVAGASGALQHDRIILRNRIVPGDGSVHPSNVEEQAYIEVDGGSAIDLLGLPADAFVTARKGATVKSASILGIVGWASGQFTGAADARDGQPTVVFFDGTGLAPANDVFKFTFDGVPVVVEFPSSETGTEIALGPVSAPGSVLYRIAEAMVDVGLQLSVADVIADGFVRQEGAGFRLTSGLFDLDSRIEIGGGSANDTLGFLTGDVAERTPVEASAIASALMSHAHPVGSVSSLYLSYDASPLYFAGRALAGVEEDDAGAQFVYLQSQTLGLSSSVAIQQSSQDDVNLPGTGLLGAPGEGAVGELGVDGFTVTSSDPVDGSGTANTSVFNSGEGQDGVVGQTYRDLKTGLTFTILPREGGGRYPIGPTSFFSFRVSSTVRTDSNLPVRVIPGLELRVQNTTGVVAGDSAIVETFERGGNEPAIGDLYYVTYDYLKQDFSTRLFTRLSAVEEEYGPVSPENPVSLATYLQFLNGSVVTGITQVSTGGTGDASEADFRNAVDSLRGPLPGLIFPDILVPLYPATEGFSVFMAQHCDVQSSIRNRAERTALLGYASGTQPNEAGRIAQATNATRVRTLYPDILRLTLTDALGNQRQFLVDGKYMAAAFSGRIVNPNSDVATPWTNREIVGFDEIARTLDAVQQNQVAVQGVTIVTQGQPFSRVRQGLTTRMENILTRTPTVIQIADEVHRQTRSTLDRFIGIKFLPTVLGQLEGRVSQMFRNLVRSQVVASYTGISAQIDPDDPTTALVEGFYKPVFPLLYIIVSYSVRASD